MILIELEISPDLQLSQKIWSSLAHEDLFGNFVGKGDNMLQEFDFCDSLKQSIKHSFCATS
jgi:hypothetical protein